MVVFGTWMIVACYAVAHDQYLVSIAPEHFTEYHANPFEIDNSRLLAAFIGFQASVSPGLVLGISTWFVARAGSKPKISPKGILSSVLCVIVATELLGASVGYVSYQTRTMIFPASMYPDHSRQMITTQTIQLICYFSAIVGSLVMLISMFVHRKRMGLSKLSTASHGNMDKQHQNS